MEIKNRKDIPEFLNDQNLIGYGVEIGVLQGDFSSEILKKWNGQKLYLIDAWRDFPEMIDINKGDHNYHLDNYAKTFMKIYEFGTRATIIREPSPEAANLFPDGFFDWGYLDANHTYINMTMDLNAWYSKVKIGGYFMGHDYLNGTYTDSYENMNNIKKHTIFEVKRAVDDFARSRKIKVNVTQEDHIFKSWYFLKEK